MDKNIIKGTMLSLEGAALVAETHRQFGRLLCRADCGDDLHKLHA